jgi:glycosyltransferase involved in cell wall biosynthesis
VKTTVLDVVIPVYNEESDLWPCVQRLHGYLTESFPYPFRITIADNASTDETLNVAYRLAKRYEGVAVSHLDAKGRGRALKAVWQDSDAEVLAYMDVDLSTDLKALGPLVSSLLSGHSDLAIGSRLTRGSRVVRGAKREFISRSYNLLLKSTLKTKFSDAQCGFKAIRRDAARELLPLVEDTGWFFDTELLVLAEKAGLRIHEVPVDWTDDPDSRVDIVATAIADLKGIARLGKALMTGRLPLNELRERLGRNDPVDLTRQVMSFAAIGVLSTLAYLVIFAALRGVTGAQAANLLALLVTAVANTAANRRFSFGITGRQKATTHQLQGLAVFVVCLGLTSGSLALLHALTTAPARMTEVAVLVGANALATLLRFLLLRGWVFR